jgi:hypothetical protein
MLTPTPMITSDAHAAVTKAPPRLPPRRYAEAAAIAAPRAMMLRLRCALPRYRC